MKTIIIKQISLTNFKGVRELTVNFDRDITNIYGRNGSGKTTIFDAFTWLLFGKDSIDRKAFDLKTLDTDGNIIQQIPHEVSAIIEVNGTEVRLTRRFTEKWVKRAGKVEKEFDGNKEERFFNDVPCGKKEYEDHIADICREDIFKFITSPTYFTAQKAEAQKAMLQQMAGNITDEEVAADNADFKNLLEAITGKTLAEYKREISAKKSRINADLVDLPGRIDEKKRDIAKAESEIEDWSALEAELKTKREARDEINRQLEDISARDKAASEAQHEVFCERMRLQEEIHDREFAVKEAAMKDYYEARRRKSEVQGKIDFAQSIIDDEKRDIEAYQREVAKCEETRTRMLAAYAALIEKRNSIRAEQLTIDESVFVCPTCGRTLEIADIETKRAEMLQNFEKQRAERLERVALEIAQNKRDGVANNERKESQLKRIKSSQHSIEIEQKTIAELQASADYTGQIDMPDVAPAIAGDATLKELRAKLAAVTDVETSETSEDSKELRNGRDMLTQAIEGLIARLSKRADIKAMQQRVNELETQMRTLNEELAELEKKEFTISEFSKARNAAIEARINGLFRYVKFRWLAVAINGAESETCEATINGVPYSSLNNAGRIIAGLDIINAICTSQGITAPIFIDNAESVNDIIPMQSQIINLIVSRDEKLRVEAVNK